VLLLYVQKFSVAQPLEAIQYQRFLSQNQMALNVAEILKQKEVIAFFFEKSREAQQNVQML